ncbi:hypothetical protein NLJ89_g10653 [Agrocybe chaxingu]|uniref:Ricin B lectin domain-containing protein n=1 Tax=Agrocybe chaxingu TaxID=84603 RepID=A0A9W8JQB6_9AGAR|nr:hypothetical protein NLJ89_g10653 [Agrocybe chaxingu]
MGPLKLDALLNFLLASSLWIAHATAQNPGDRSYTIVNNCPTAVDLVIGGVIDSTLPVGGSTTKFASGSFTPGFFYTTANGGNVNGQATKAGFYDDNNSYYYYMVKDEEHFNIGMSIAPNHPEINGFCPTILCESASCTTAYPFPPTRFPPPVCETPPPPPVYSCPYANLTYTITFCPSGSFPVGQPSGTTIHPNGNPSKCMDVRGAIYTNGTPVQIYDCNGTGAQKWVLNRGSTKVRLAGTNFCLDAGSAPANGVGMKIWECFDNLPAQQWFFTTDDRIALEGRG